MPTLLRDGVVVSTHSKKVLMVHHLAGACLCGVSPRVCVGSCRLPLTVLWWA